MKIISWNCRGLGGPSTISQLKESQRLYTPDITFLCETKRGSSFVERTTKKLQLNERWAVNEPKGKKGGMLVTWSQNVEVRNLWMNDFCMELRVEVESEGTDL